MGPIFLDPGAMRSEFSLQAASLTSDNAGGHSETWQEVGTVFARVEPVSTKVVQGAGQSLETVTHRISLRRRGDIASGMRLVRQSRVFDILTVHDPDDSGRYLICYAKESGL